MKSFLPQLGLLCAMILWASSFVALKIAIEFYDPMVVIFGRMFMGSLCFFVVYLRYRANMTIKRKDIPLLLFMIFCEPCLYFIFEAQAIVYTTASQAGMITAIAPVLVIISAALFLGERTGWRGWWGALLAVGGVVWLTVMNSPQENAPNPILGNFLEFIAMICATGYTIAMRKFVKNGYSPFFLTAIQAIGGTIFFFPALFLPSTELPGTFVLEGVFAIIYLGVFITLGAYGLYSYGLQHMEASRAAMYGNLIPVFSVIWGWTLLGERLSGFQFVAAGVVMFGVWFSQTQKK